MMSNASTCFDRVLREIFPAFIETDASPLALQESKDAPSFAAIVKEKEHAPPDHKAPSALDAALDPSSIEPIPAPGADKGTGYPTLQEAAEVTGPTGSEAEAKTSFTPPDDAATPSASDATAPTSDKAAADAKAGSALAGAAGIKGKQPGEAPSDTGASDEVTKAAGAKPVDPGTGEPASGEMAKELKEKLPLGATVAHVEGSAGETGVADVS